MNSDCPEAEFIPATTSDSNEGEGDSDTSRIGDDSEDTVTATPRRSPAKLALVVGSVIVLALASLTGWLGLRSHQLERAAEQRAEFLQAGRQTALDLTTIDWQHADEDVERILNNATGAFYDEFSTRAQPFVDVVKQSQSKSVGKVTEAALESVSDGAAQVLVAVGVQTVLANQPEQNPRLWRMRIGVEKVGDQAKVSKVEFVP